MKKLIKSICRTILMIIFFISIPLIYLSIFYSFDKGIEFLNLELGSSKVLFSWLYFVIIITVVFPFIALWILPMIFGLFENIKNKIKPKKVLKKELTIAERYALIPKSEIAKMQFIKNKRNLEVEREKQNNK